MLYFSRCVYVCIFSLFFDESRSELASVIFHLLKPEVIFNILIDVD